MGAPKQKWTQEEESALKSGVAKHGTGKWRNILRDPDFCMILRFRSNIDLKDKWRNMTVTSSGWGSRERVKSSTRKSRRLSKNKEESEGEEEDNQMAISTEVEEDSGNSVIDAAPFAMSCDPLQIESGYDNKEQTRLDNLILDAIRNLKEPNGSNKATISAHIEERFWPPSDFQIVLSTEINSLVDSGKLIKVKQNYKIAPGQVQQIRKPRTPRMPPLSNYQNYNDTKPLAMPRMDAEMAPMSPTTNQEPAEIAARAVVEAELAIAEAEEASRRAEALEADALAAQAFVEAAILAFKNRSSSLLMFQA